METEYVWGHMAMGYRATGWGLGKEIRVCPQSTDFWAGLAWS